MNSGFGFADPSDPLSPKAGEKRSVRVCDWYAWKLSSLDGSPPFEPYWPEETRDAAFKALSAFVTEWGSNFRWNEQQQSLFAPPFDPVRLTFPRHHRPATPGDVEAHNAIFSLDGSAQAHVVPLTSFPTKAKWTTLKQFKVYSEVLRFRRPSYHRQGAGRGN
jgi:hypothetical protein